MKTKVCFEYPSFNVNKHCRSHSPATSSTKKFLLLTSI